MQCWVGSTGWWHAGLTAIALSYPKVERCPEDMRSKTWLVGNPVREEVLALRDTALSR